MRGSALGGGRSEGDAAGRAVKQVGETEGTEARGPGRGAPGAVARLWGPPLRVRQGGAPSGYLESPARSCDVLACGDDGSASGPALTGRRNALRRAFSTVQGQMHSLCLVTKRQRVPSEKATARRMTHHVQAGLVRVRRQRQRRQVVWRALARARLRV